jgi:hypothetical protein
MFNKLTCLAPLVILAACGSGGDSDASQSSTLADTSSLTTLDSTDSGDDDSGDGDSGDGDSGDGDPDSGDGDGDTDGHGDGDGGLKFDVLGNVDDAGTAATGCTKVDFLFVIDNSGSMLQEQTNLLASFPGFISSMMSALSDAQDYHIMVIDVDRWVYKKCPYLCAYPLPGICVGYECGVTEPAECEDILGAGVTYPRGANASNMDCNFASGKRFMTSDEPNLVETFQCAALVGTDSTDEPERPMEAMVEAVSGVGAVGDCNVDFLRDDAILVVTFITDEDDDEDDGSAGTVDSWRQALIDAKNGDESAIVVLGLFGDGDLPNALCNGSVPTSIRLRMFLDSWGDHGFFGSICAPSYDDFFQNAVDHIKQSCNDFTSPR